LFAGTLGDALLAGDTETHGAALLAESAGATDAATVVGTALFVATSGVAVVGVGVLAGVHVGARRFALALIGADLA
jgi:hypothetical protein